MPRTMRVARAYLCVARDDAETAFIRGGAPSPATRPPAGRQQNNAGDGGDNAVLGVHARDAVLMTRHEARQLIGRQQEIDGGCDEKDNAEQ